MNEQTQGAPAPEDETTTAPTPGAEPEPTPPAAPDTPDEPAEPEAPAEPDVHPHENAIQGDQGEQVADAAAAPGFDPDRPVRTSAPEPEAQSGVPNLTDGSNEGVEPQPEYAGPVDPPATEGTEPATAGGPTAPPAAPSE